MRRQILTVSVHQIQLKCGHLLPQPMVVDIQYSPWKCWSYWKDRRLGRSSPRSHLTAQISVSVSSCSFTPTQDR